MATFESTQLIDALSAPVGSLIASVGHAVADAQQAMDVQTINNLRRVYDESDDFFGALRDIGYRPTWYHIPEVTAELQVALTVSGEETARGSGASPNSGVGGPASKIAIYAAPVDAGYMGRYNYALNAASTVKFKVVPVPPSPQAEAMRVVPNLVGSPYRVVQQKLAALNLPFTISGLGIVPSEDAIITAQNPQPGEILTGGAVAIGF